MSDATPPPQFVQYPRGQNFSYGTVEHLQAMGDGYFGLNGVFYVNVFLALGMRALISNQTLGPASIFVAVSVMLAVIGFLTLRFNKKIAFGKGWPEWSPVLCSVLMGINSALCCGVVGYLVMQMIASQEMRRYGMTIGYLGLNKKDFNAFVQKMREAQGGPTGAPLA
jgi:cobalamin synthase